MPQEKPKKKKLVSSVKQSIWKRSGEALEKRTKQGARYDDHRAEKQVFGGGLLKEWREQDQDRIKKQTNRMIRLDNMKRRTQQLPRRISKRK
jgi:hypothetical protein